MSLAEDIKRAEEEARKEGHAEGGAFFKFQEGDNRFRILTKPVMVFKAGKDLGYAICYTGCGYTGRPRFICYVLDRKDERVKLAEFPATVGNTIAGYETDEDYAFTSFPMPYDIKVSAAGAGTKDVEYTITPGRANTEVSEHALAELSKKETVASLIEKDKEKARKMHGSGIGSNEDSREVPESSYDKHRESDVSPEDIPF